MRHLAAPTIALLLLIAAPAAAQQNTYSLMQARIRSAQQIIDGNNDYIQRARCLHAEMQETILLAETLKGKATDLQIKINEANLRPHLTGAQLKAAQAQYADDLNQFQLHAKDYADHLERFRATLGECHANEALYQQQVQQYSLHLEKFHLHMPTIRPPHICGAMQLSELEMRHISQQLMEDNKRVQRAEADLRVSENKLVNAMAQENSLAGKALTKNKREVEEQKLAQEFARLKEEYETLSVEHAALAGKNTGASLSTKSVHGTIQR